jgi:asparagine synthase (glutamine-hydrolysing)
LGGRAATYRDVGDKLHKLARGLDATDCRSLYRRLIARWPRDSGLVLGMAATADTDDTDDRDATAPGAHPWPPANHLAPDLAWMMGADTVGYLPGDILAKVDRAAMSVSLETRIPFLDRQVYECAWSMPATMKVRGRQSKVALRRLLDRHLPRALIERPKTGFGIPIDDWLRGPLREWASDLLAPARLKREAVLDPGLVGDCWQRHLSGRQNLQQHLWPILMFQQWCDSRR